MKRIIGLLIISIVLISCGGESGGTYEITKGLRIFVTKSTHHGDFANDPNLNGNNGIEKADDFCNKDAHKPSNTIYKALIVDGVNRDAFNQINWVLQSNTKYYRADGTTLIGTTNASAIFDVAYGTLDNSIALPTITTGIDTYVLTGISNAADFTTGSDDYHCYNYSSKDENVTNTLLGDEGPKYGFGEKTNEWAFANALINANCASRLYFYCVEQP